MMRVSSGQFFAGYRGNSVSVLLPDSAIGGCFVRLRLFLTDTLEPEIRFCTDWFDLVLFRRIDEKSAR